MPVGDIVTQDISLDGGNVHVFIEREIISEGTEMDEGKPIYTAELKIKSVRVVGNGEVRDQVTKTKLNLVENTKTPVVNDVQAGCVKK